MATYLYLHAPWRRLVERRIREGSGDEEFILICAADTHAWARELENRFPSVKACLGDDEPVPLSEFPGEPFVVLPIAFDTRPLRHKLPVEMPCLAPYYALFQQCRRMGFREVEIFSLAGTRRIAVPMLLDAFHNRHRGSRCFVVGNGPSLNRINVQMLQDEITLGSNQCYLGYPEWGFHFTYWGVSDQYQIEAYGEEYEDNISGHEANFVPFEYAPLLRLPHTCPVNQVWCREAAHQFSDAPDKVYRGYTVTYMLMQIAAIMGCDPIILVGADHDYPLSRRYIASKNLRRLRRHVTRRLRDGSVYRLANAIRFELLRLGARGGKGIDAPLWEAAHATGPTHFTDKYTGSGARKFNPPEPEEAEADFRCARDWAERRHVTILNATPGSKLRVFDRVSFDDLF